MLHFRLFVVLVILTSAGYGWTAERIVVTATGEASLANVTPEEAQKTALQKARLSAVEMACGVKLQAESFVRDYVLLGDFIHAVSYGHIVSEEVKSWKVEVEQKNPRTPPALTYLVTIKASVLQEKGNPDPSYQAKVRLNKNVYQSGDEMVIHVSATKPSYLTVLNFTADDRVILLFPNALRRNNRIEREQEYQLPSSSNREGILKLQVSNLPDHKRDTEYIKVIATTRPIPLLEGLAFKGQYGVMDTVSVAATEIARLISSIPVNERAESTAAYEIVSGQ
jgi:hypothetical protein